MKTLTLARPAALALHRTVSLAPRCCIPEPDSVCECGGLIAYIRGTWQHADQCPDCTGPAGPRCAGKHVGCTDPSPLVCQHGRCRNPVTVVRADAPHVDRCAWDGAADACCGCCWNLDVS